MVRRFFRLGLHTIGAVTVIGIVITGFILITLGHWLQTETALEKSDFIVPLAGDDHRLLRAADLYKQGYAPVILLSNARVLPLTRVEEIEVKLGHARAHPYQRRKEMLDFLGIPATATAEFGNGHISTVEEAEALHRYLGDRATRVILVTSAYHTRRALLIFEREMPKVEFMVASPPEARLHEPWWGEQDSAIRTVLEAAKLAYFWLGGAFRHGGAPAR